MKNEITACIDGSANSSAVCDSATWASRILNAPLSFLHVLEKSLSPAREDFSGALGLDSRERLLSELTELDEQRNKLAVEHGKHLLAEVQARAEAAGAREIHCEQRFDRLLDALLERQEKTRLYVIGRMGGGHQTHQKAIGSQVENLVRAVQTPILMATGQFSEPRNYLLAYDGSETANRAIDRIAGSPLLRGLPGHMVMVANDTADNRQRLDHARGLLEGRGFAITAHLAQGNVTETLVDFQTRLDIELKVMGAYGHSRIREFILGSNTTRMLATSTVPVLILR